MDDNEFWIRIWANIAIVIVVIIAAITAYNMHRNSIAHDLIKSGTPAMEVSCALDSPSSSSKCTVLAAKHN